MNVRAGGFLHAYDSRRHEQAVKAALRSPEINTVFNETVREYQRRGYLFGSAVMLARIDIDVPAPAGWLFEKR